MQRVRKSPERAYENQGKAGKIMFHITEKYFDETVQSIAEILRFDSSMKPAEENAPFGKETADCLAYFLDLAKSMGFETNNYDNYAGEVIFGNGEDFAILAHLDVVPAGDGWKYPPFGGVINDDVSDGGVTGKKIWGRGALDDKAPAVCCLYALKALKDEGFVPARRIKLIVGCNEESGWKCMEHYKKVAVMPKEGFSPDADFPVIYAEKGILHVTLSFPMENPPFTALRAGERVNMVCDKAVAVLTKRTGQSLVAYENDVAGTSFSYDNTTNILTVRGKSAHGSTPEKGANALQAALQFFSALDENCKRAYDTTFGETLQLRSIQDETGVLTLSPNMATYQDGVLKISADIRIPSTHDKAEVLQAFENAGVAVTVNNFQAPIYNDPNGELIQTLLAVYNRATGENAKPIAIGGGTYARVLERGCAFGPEMAGEEVTIHQPNEYVTFERVKLMNEVYYEAVKELTTPPKTYYRLATLKVKKIRK